MGHMSKERTNIYITDRQKKQLEKRSQEENLPMAEIIRRALDAYLAWDDPTYTPHPNQPERNGALIPRLKDGGFPAHVS
jgi:hypothetical protein